MNDKHNADSDVTTPSHRVKSMKKLPRDSSYLFLMLVKLSYQLSHKYELIRSCRDFYVRLK